MNHFVFIHRPGPNWKPDTPILEQDLTAHFAYMTTLAESGMLVLGGGFTDDSGAMGILAAAHLAEAEQVVAADPAVTNGVVVAEVHPYMVTVGSVA